MVNHQVELEKDLFGGVIFRNYYLFSKAWQWPVNSGFLASSGWILGMVSPLVQACHSSSPLWRTNTSLSNRFAKHLLSMTFFTCLSMKKLISSSFIGQCAILGLTRRFWFMVIVFGDKLCLGTSRPEGVYSFFSFLHISPSTTQYLHQHSPSRWAKDI